LKKVNFLGYRITIPSHPVVRILLGLVLCLGGVLGFLPVLGFWMLPFGLVILSVDFAIVRRFRRRASVRLGEWMNRKYPGFAKKIGFNGMRGGKY
jgi:purine-cytosine permease-like protein